MPPERDPTRYPEHLTEHSYQVLGKEPLAKKPLAVRLYQSDDDKLRPLGKKFAAFVREAVREKLERQS